MNDEQSKLMIQMAKTLDDHSVAIKSLLTEREPAKPVEPVSAAPVSNIEREDGDHMLKVDVQFDHAETLSRDGRMEKCGKFTEALQALCNSYQVTNFRATYGTIFKA